MGNSSSETQTSANGNEADMGKGSRTSSNGSERNEESSSNSPPASGNKKRTKASRACDQCRKRKIKCDYSEEKGICTSCSKNAEKCAFDRIPLKRGPSKGYVRGHSRTRSVSSQQDGTDMPSPPSRSSSVLLPPLAQYLPQPGAAKGAGAGAAAAAPTSTPVSGASIGQQQFWKVPYHDFPNQRRGSIDSLQSDLSVGKGMGEQLLYSTPSGSQNLHSPNPASGNNDFAPGYWSFMRNSNSVVGPEEFAEMRRKSGSFPALLKHPSNSSGPQPQQLQQSANALYPYSQFSQQGKASISSFGQFGSNGFESRHGSIVSEGMSPSAPAIYQSAPMAQSASNSAKVAPASAPQQAQERASSAGSSTPSKSSKRRKKNVTQKRGKRADSNVSMTSENSSIRPPSCENNYGKPTIIYGQISDVDLIETYYEFIHVGFPIIPLNKKTLTNEILLINTQPISTIHEINNYVILWFRNALELLVRISLKKRYDQFFEAPRNGSEKNDYGESSGDSANAKPESSENDDFLENKSLFISALNECLQKIVDIHPKFRENRQEISPKVEIIYLSTFILLNYVLAFVGYDNSFVLGMSVTIFKEFKIYEQFIWGEVQDRYDEISIAFKRLYFSLVIFDSLQSCCYGGAKLLNVPIQGATEKLFKRDPENSKWDIDEDPFKTECIRQSLKLGELINDFVSNRRSVCDATGENLLWEPSDYFNFMQQSNADEPVTTVQIFHDFLLIKNDLTNKLLLLHDSKKSPLDLCLSLTNSLCTLITLKLRILMLIMKLNPTNRIDYNYRPAAPASNERVSKDHKGAQEKEKVSINRSGSDFYQKLLGLQQNAGEDSSEILRGVISPYSISILHEIRNTMDLVQQMPSSLIGIVMTIPASSEREDQAKSQELVVKLSNSMNEVVQITSLLNLIKPLKMCEQDSYTMSSWRYLTDKDHGQSVMQRLYDIRKQQTQAQPRPHDNGNQDVGSTSKNQPLALENLMDIGWKLLDDKELGWF